MHPLSAGKGQGRQQKNPKLHDHNLALYMFQLIVAGARDVWQWTSCSSAYVHDRRWMKEEKGIRPTLPGLYLSTIQPSQRGFFWVHMCVWSKPEAEFLNLLGPQPSIPRNWFLKGTTALYGFFAIYIDDLRSKIFALLKSLKIRAL